MSLPFAVPEVEDNPQGWGPQGEPNIFAGIPYQPFSKNDKLGKAAGEFTGASNYRSKNVFFPFFLRNSYRFIARYGNVYGGGDAYAYYHDEDSSFQLVDSSKVKQGYRGPKRWQVSMRCEVESREQLRRFRLWLNRCPDTLVDMSMGIFLSQTLSVLLLLLTHHSLWMIISHGCPYSHESLRLETCMA